ncbi:Zinc finger, PMZ-type [Sesbania bispinosa]|nr:Zinc finger, PMZ-type [Sesbania bispinosa]
MKGDYDIGDFKMKWENMVKEFGVEGHEWVLEIYIGQKEIEVDFVGSHGEQVLQTSYCDLERASKLKVVGSKKSLISTIYIARKHVVDDKEWFVSFHPPTKELKCSCKRFESYGILCYHILALMVYLDIDELPRSLVLDRWTQKDPIRVRTKGCSGNLPKSGGSSKLKPRCTMCRREGHNRTTCPLKRRMDNVASSSAYSDDVAMSDRFLDDESMEDQSDDSRSRY